MKNKTVYPEWKIIAWRFGRTFLASFLVAFGTGLIGITDLNTLQSVLVASLSAGIIAVAKAIRGDEVKGIKGKMIF